MTRNWFLAQRSRVIVMTFACLDNSQGEENELNFSNIAFFQKDMAEVILQKLLFQRYCVIREWIFILPVH